MSISAAVITNAGSDRPHDQAPDTTAIRGLKFAAAFTVVSGLLFASGSTGWTDGAVRILLDLVFLRPGNGPALAGSHHLVDAILGGVMAGWGVMMWMLVDRFATRFPEDVKHLLLVGLAVWFVVDSAGSIASGGWVNAVLNVGYAGLFVVPLRRL